jgi:hypothetical protein
VTFSIGADQDDRDVARMLRACANRRETELNRIWHRCGIPEPTGAINMGRQYVVNLRDAADYHERQARLKVYHGRPL